MAAKIETLLADLELEDLSDDYRQLYNGWHTVYNPRINRKHRITCIQTISKGEDVPSVDISYNDEYLAISSSPFVLIADAQDGQELCKFSFEAGSDECNYTTGVTFSPCGNFLATISEDVDDTLQVSNLLQRGEARAQY